jgi:hypothetical protein
MHRLDPITRSAARSLLADSARMISVAAAPSITAL